MGTIVPRMSASTPANIPSFFALSGSTSPFAVSLCSARMLLRLARSKTEKFFSPMTKSRLSCSARYLPNSLPLPCKSVKSRTATFFFSALLIRAASFSVKPVSSVSRLCPWPNACRFIRLRRRIIVRCRRFISSVRCNLSLWRCQHDSGELGILRNILQQSFHRHIPRSFVLEPCAARRQKLLLCLASASDRQHFNFEVHGGGDDVFERGVGRILNGLPGEHECVELSGQFQFIENRRRTAQCFRE